MNTLTELDLNILETGVRLGLPAALKREQLLECISMARRTLEAEERLAKAQTTIFFFASVIKCGESWSPECQKWMDEALGRPKALHPPQECAPPSVTDVPPDKDQVCAHGVPIGYVCPECDAEAMRKGLDDHSCNSTGWEKP